jgi:transcriptional regulator with XRE-family HTH domain
MNPPTAPPPRWHSLRHYRTKAGLSLAELAQRAGMSESGVQHLEAGRRRPRPRTVVRLAKALGIPADKLRADFADNPAAEEQLDDLREQVAVLSERIEHATAALPGPRSKTAQEVA